MAKNILQGVAGTIVETISTVEIKNKIEDLVLSYNEYITFRSKELQESLLTFKNYLNDNSTSLFTKLSEVEIDLNKEQYLLQEFSELVLRKLASIIYKSGVQYKEYNRYNTITNYRIDHYGYNNTLSNLIGPNYKNITPDATTGFLSEQTLTGVADSKLYENRYFYFKDANTDDTITALTDNTHATLKSNYGIFIGLNNFASYNLITSTLHLGESSAENETTDIGIRDKIRAKAINNIILPDGVIDIKGEVKIVKNLSGKGTLDITGASTFRNDVNVLNGDITLLDASSAEAFSVNTAGDLKLKHILTITGSGLANTQSAVTISKGGITLTDGHITLASGNATLTSGDLTLTSGNATLTSGNLTLSNGNFNINGNQYIDNDNGIYVKKLNATDGTGASSVLTKDTLTVGQNGEATSVKIGKDSYAILDADANDFTIYKKFISLSTVAAAFSSGVTFDGAISGKDTLNLNNSISNLSVFNVGNAGDTDIKGSLIVAKATTLNNTLDVVGNKATNLSGTLDVTGATTLKSSLSVTNNTNIGGTLIVDEATTLKSSLDVTTNLKVTGTITGGNDSSIGGCTFNNKIMTGTATAAYYADVAEYYTTDKKYEAGTILQYSRNDLFYEAELFSGGVILGVVSDKPGYILNQGLADKEQSANMIVLKGRSPIKLSSYCDHELIIRGNIALACSIDHGKAIIIDYKTYIDNINIYQSRYIGQVVNTTVIDNTVELKF